MPAKSSKTRALLEESISDQVEALRKLSATHSEELLAAVDSKLSLNVQIERAPVDSAILTDNTESVLESSITKGEYNAIIKKLLDLTEHFQEQSEDSKLYLEQQITDLVGISISSELRGFRLPHAVVTLKSGNFGKPGNESNKPASPRSFFGPYRGSQYSDEQAARLPDFGISLPLHLTDKWRQDPFATSEWFKYRQLLLVNPAESVAVVCAITDTYTDPLVRYQGAASPVLIREGMIWSQVTQGTVLLFFIDTPKAVPFGVRDISWEQKTSS